MISPFSKAPVISLTLLALPPHYTHITLTLHSQNHALLALLVARRPWTASSAVQVRHRPHPLHLSLPLYCTCPDTPFATTA